MADVSNVELTATPRLDGSQELVVSFDLSFTGVETAEDQLFEYGIDIWGDDTGEVQQPNQLPFPFPAYRFEFIVFGAADPHYYPVTATRRSLRRTETRFVPRSAVDEDPAVEGRIPTGLIDGDSGEMIYFDGSVPKKDEIYATVRLRRVEEAAARSATMTVRDSPFW